MGLPTIPTGAAIIVSAAGIIITMFVTIYYVGKWTGKISDKLDSLNDVSTLSTQIQTITSTFDFTSASRVPENIESLSNDVTNVTDQMAVMDSLDSSIDNIEAAITSVDLKGIEEAIERLFENEFGDGLPMGNSVQHTLERSGIDVAISLSALGEGGMQVTFRFGQNVKTSALTQLLEEDEELGHYEQEQFGSESDLSIPSPRQLNFVIYSRDMDSVTEWVPRILDEIDQYLIESETREDEFDEKVSEALRETGK